MDGYGDMAFKSSIVQLHFFNEYLTRDALWYIGSCMIFAEVPIQAAIFHSR